MTIYKLIFISFLSFVLFLSSCKTGSDEQSTQSDTIHIRKKSDPKKLNPYVYPSPVSRDVYQYIFPQLADFDPVTLKLTPVLIKSLPSEIDILNGKYKGGVQFDIEFLEEAKWDNGTDVTGYDYLFSIKMARNPLVKAAGYRAHLKHITEVVIDESNPKKFSVIFDEAYLLAKETALTLEVYPSHIYDPEGLLSEVTLSDLSDSDILDNVILKDSTMTRWAEDINGVKHCREIVESCGPYKLKEWVTNEYVVLERKDNFWAQNTSNTFLKAVPKQIVFNIIPDETAAITQLKEGGLDVITGVTGPSFANLSKTNPEFQFFTPELVRYYMLSLNNDSPELSDKNVRKAIAHLLDIDNIISTIDYGNGKRTIGPIHPSKSYYNKSLTPLPYDKDKAIALLTKAGWADTDNDGIIDKMINGIKTQLDLDIYVSSGKLGQQIALLLQEAAKEANIKINIIQKEYRQIESENIVTRKYDLAPQVVNQDLVLDDPYTRWHSDHDTPSGRNVYGFYNAEIDSITKIIQTTKDQNLRDRLYYRVQEILYDEQPVIFLYAPSERIVVSPDWKATSTVRRPGYLANTFSTKE